MTYKAIVIGSGAGGSAAASVLAERWGDQVLLIEAGKTWAPGEFTQLERSLVPQLYAGGGTQATEDGAVSLMQGKALGGSTVINDALCFTPPEEMHPRWDAHGAPFDQAAFDKAVLEVEQVIGASEIPRSMINRANYLVGLGAARMGWEGERLRHNSIGCQQCGFRHIGCAYGAKRSFDRTFLYQYKRDGGQIMDRTTALRMGHDGKVWTVRVSGPQGVVDLKAELVFVAAGVVQTPALLLRSGVVAGAGVQVHLQTMAWGEFEEPVDAHNGIPMAYGVTEFSDVYGRTGPGYIIEGCNVQPLAFSTQPQFEGPEHQEVLSRYRHLAGAVSLIRSSSRGQITLSKEGRAKIDYPVNDHDFERVQHFYERATEMFLAAGAKRVLLSHRKTRWIDSVPGQLDLGPGKQYLYSAHLFGGANRGYEEGGGVTDRGGRVRGQPNLWVVDASAFPEALGVNPQVAIGAMAIVTARDVVGRFA